MSGHIGSSPDAEMPKFPKEHALISMSRINRDSCTNIELAREEPALERSKDSSVGHSSNLVVIILVLNSDPTSSAAINTA